MQASPTDLSSEAYKKNPHDQIGLKTIDSCSTYTLLLPVFLGHWSGGLRKKLWTFESEASERIFSNLHSAETIYNCCFFENATENTKHTFPRFG